MADGRTALAVGSYIEEGSSAPFLQKIEHILLAAIPSRFSAIDIRALRNGYVFQQESVVYNLYGFPEKEKEWGEDEHSSYTSVGTFWSMSITMAESLISSIWRTD